VRQLGDLLARENSLLVDLLQAKMREKAPLDDELRTGFGWVAARLTRRGEVGALRARIAALDTEIEALGRAQRDTRAVFLALLHRSVLPYVIRARVSHAFEEAVARAADRFNRFVDELDRAFEDAWQRATVSRIDRPTAETVLTPAKIETVYRRVMHREPMSGFVRQVLGFFPPNTAPGDKNRLSYGACLHLGDHYLAGPRSLLDRTAAFAAALFVPAESLDALDIVETGRPDGSAEASKDEALAYLKDRVGRLSRFVEFSPGLLPLVTNEQAMHTIFVVRTPGGEQARLAREYDHLFRPQCRYVDTDDPLTIHVAAIIVAFPAFVLHALEGGRRFLSAQGLLAADLWPEASTPPRDDGSERPSPGAGER